ncbi:MAG: HAD-IA family hydrolase [Hormoscilla sp. GUM202]|nr:HAD-IA family hydrolase [Hormoscilla sp. GUM202]
MKQPKVIFLDAVGTLFGIRGTVGEVYAMLARQSGVEVAAEALDAAFIQSFRSSRPAAFPGINPVDIPTHEYNWWKVIAMQTFQQVRVWQQFSDFDSFFSKLYAYFATTDPWFVYPDVFSALSSWQQSGIELGVLSNFDSRIYSVLQAFGLAEFFRSVTISTEVGAAKPDRHIFAAALAKHNCFPSDAWHIGDSFKEDYQAAQKAGLQAIWLKRNNQEAAGTEEGDFWTTLQPQNQTFDN